MFTVTPRLRRIIDHVNGKRVADIGCDHAYVAITLIDEKRANSVIACDVNKGPLLIAEENIKKYNKSNCIETRLGSGIEPINKGEADTIIIAGMGGELIENILKNDIEKAREAQLILQPMNSQHTLRKWLIENDFKIILEDIAVEGFKVYNILNVQSGQKEPFEKEIYYHIPPYLKNNKNYRFLYDKKKREFEKIIKGLEKSADIDEEKLFEYKNLLKELEQYCKI